MKLNSFHQLESDKKRSALEKCCGSHKWIELMLKNTADSLPEFIQNAVEIWYHNCAAGDWKEAFRHHPKIGNTADLAKKFASTESWSKEEQKSVGQANAVVIQELAEKNQEYEDRFGFIFIVCASGKSADEMLRLLNDRLSNNKEEELLIAMGEQGKITTIRLQKLLSETDFSGLRNSQITTHVLDTSLGLPGESFTIRLQGLHGSEWLTIAQGVTNADGRIGDLMPSERILPAGNYQMVFDTDSYFRQNNITGFYPEVAIQFKVFDDKHYHIPLLINPYGYTTYRGS